MSEFTRKIGGTVFLDETRLWAAVSNQDTPAPRRLSEFMRLAGVRFFDERRNGYNFVLEPLAAVTGFGGFPISFDASTPAGCFYLNGALVTPSAVLEQFKNTMGRAGFYSYMNPGNHAPTKMDEVTTRLAHFSKAHTVTVDMAVLGYSAAIEGNLMKLRPWVNHVGRLTNTRTLAQSCPPLVVMDPADLQLAQRVRASVSRLLSDVQVPRKGVDQPREQYQELLADHYERVNALWPNSRALILMVNAGLSDLRGTMGDIADKGQEREYHNILALINDNLWSLFPQMFRHSSSYGYQMPHHWPGRARWEAARGGSNV